VRATRDAWLALLPAALAVALLLGPLAALAARAPWPSVLEELRAPAVLDALRLSLFCSLGAAAGCLVLGLPLAAWLARGGGPARALIRVLVVLPLVLPPVVGGIALLMAFGRAGLFGSFLERIGVTLPFTTLGVVVAETWVAMPFFVLTAEAALRAFDRRYEDAAATLGASRWHVFRTVTLPMCAPSLQAGLVLAWARALGEFGATITFAGNLAGRTRTTPLAVFVALETNPDGAVALSLLLVVVSALLLVLVRDRWRPAA